MGSNKSRVNSGKTPFFYVPSIHDDVSIHSHRISFRTARSIGNIAWSEVLTWKSGPLPARKDLEERMYDVVACLVFSFRMLLQLLKLILPPQPQPEVQEVEQHKIYQRKQVNSSLLAPDAKDTRLIAYQMVWEIE